MELEAALKKRCSKKLEGWGWLVVHIIQTNRNGWPDTFIMRRGEAIWIEFKRLGKVPRELQEYRHKEIRGAGGSVFTVDKIEDIEKFR